MYYHTIYVILTNTFYHYISGQAYPLLAKRTKIVSGLNSLDDWQKRQEWKRTALKDVVGSFPQKTAYQNKNAVRQLIIVSMKPDENMDDLLTEWMK